MGLKGFRCPKADGCPIKFEECLSKCISPDGLRCCSRPTLQLMSRTRKWNGIPSTTQLLNGTLMEFLKITNDFYESPMNMAFRVQGTKVHSGLEAQDDEMSLQEEQFNEGISGKPDCLEMENGITTLYDFKTSAAYKVKKALGIKKVEIPTDQVFKSGPRKGQPKMLSEYRKTDSIDMRDWILQVNHYRIMFEKAGFKIDRMIIEAFIKDYNMAKNTKIIGHDLKPVELIDVPFMPDQEVLDYFNEKSRALLSALELNKTPEICTVDERWEDKRCESYCPVNHFCVYWKQKLQEKEALQKTDTAAFSDEVQNILKEELI